MSVYPSRIDLVTAMRNPNVSFKANEMQGGRAVLKGSRIIQYSGGYTTVFPFNNSASKKVAIRCWIADIDNAKKRSEEISKYLAALKNPYFCNFKYVQDALLVNGVVHPVVIMDWVEGKTLKDFIDENISSHVVIKSLADNFKDMVAYFHKQNIAHGDLQHGNILVKPDGSLIVIDYDSMYIEPLKGMKDAIKGLPGYQHPARINNKFINPKLDYFSELVIYLSLLVFANEPTLWSKYSDTEDLLFSRADFESPDSSKLINMLSNSANDTIAELTHKMKEQLNIGNIDDLLPIEDLIVDKLEVAKENIANKWDKQPNPPEKKRPKFPDKKSITDKF